MLINNQVQIKDQTSPAVTQKIKGQDVASLDKMLLKGVPVKDVSTLGAATEDAQWLFSQIDTIMVAAGASFTQRDGVRGIVNEMVPIFYSDSPNTDHDIVWDVAKLAYGYPDNGSKILGIRGQFPFTREQQKQIGGYVAQVIGNMYEKNGFYNPDDNGGAKKELLEAIERLKAGSEDQYYQAKHAINEFFDSGMDSISFGELQEKMNNLVSSFDTYMENIQNPDAYDWIVVTFSSKRAEKLMAKIQETYVS